MKGVVGNVFFFIGGAVALVCGLGGMFINFQIIHHVAGFWGIVIGLVILPVTFVAAPIYAIFEWGNWLPAALIYGGGMFSMIFFGIGSQISEYD